MNKGKKRESWTEQFDMRHQDDKAGMNKEKRARSARNDRPTEGFAGKGRRTPPSGRAGDSEKREHFL
jgi:hypothetical protein